METCLSTQAWSGKKYSTPGLLASNGTLEVSGNG